MLIETISKLDAPFIIKNRNSNKYIYYTEWSIYKLHKFRKIYDLLFLYNYIITFHNIMRQCNERINDHDCVQRIKMKKFGVGLTSSCAVRAAAIFDGERERESRQGSFTPVGSVVLQSFALRVGSSARRE